MWTWKISQGELLNAAGNHIDFGYSGRGWCVNNPDCCNVKGLEDWVPPVGVHMDIPGIQFIPNAGPIPVGKYTIGAPVDSHGGYALPLSPWPDNEMHGRRSFLIHGGFKSDPPPSAGNGNASLGCIIVARPPRVGIWESGDHTIRVVRGDENES